MKPQAEFGVTVMHLGSEIRERSGQARAQAEEIHRESVRLKQWSRRLSHSSRQLAQALSDQIARVHSSHAEYAAW